MRVNVKIDINALFLTQRHKEIYKFTDLDILNKCFNTEKFINILKEKIGDIGTIVTLS